MLVVGHDMIWGGYNFPVLVFYEQLVVVRNARRQEQL
jgi:hypothetical protein